MHSIKVYRHIIFVISILASISCSSKTPDSIDPKLIDFRLINNVNMQSRGDGTPNAPWLTYVDSLAEAHLIPNYEYYGCQYLDNDCIKRIAKKDFDYKFIEENSGIINKAPVNKVFEHFADYGMYSVSILLNGSLTRIEFWNGDVILYSRTGVEVRNFLNSNERILRSISDSLAFIRINE